METLYRFDDPMDEDFAIAITKPEFLVDNFHLRVERVYSREFLDSLCYIFKGARIKAGESSSVSYYYSDTLFGYKYKGSSPDDLSPNTHFASCLREYPKEFETVAENTQRPSPSEAKKHFTPGDPVYRTKINYYVIVPTQYSIKKYNELKNKFISHKKLIDDMIINSKLVNCFGRNSDGVERLCFSIMKSGIYFRNGSRDDRLFKPKDLLCRFWDYGMEELPNKMDVITAFTNTLVNQFFQLYPVQPGYAPKVIISMNPNGEHAYDSSNHINERECYVTILLNKLETQKRQPDGLKKW